MQPLSEDTVFIFVQNCFVALLNKFLWMQFLRLQSEYLLSKKKRLFFFFTTDSFMEKEGRK